MTFPITDAISVIVHDDPDRGYRVSLDVGGEHLTFGCEPMSHATIGAILNQPT